MRVDQDVLLVLQDLSFVGVGARIMSGQLDRAMYQRVNKVLEAAGGRWNKAAKAHLFPGPAAEAIEQIMLTGEVLDAKQELGAFFTPERLAADLVDRAIQRLAPKTIKVANIRALEPSAGEGAIVQAMLNRGISNIVACEVNLDFIKRRPLCYPTRMRWTHADFLTAFPPQDDGDFDVVVMNPPFAKRADIRHITHAAKFVRSGGVLISVASASVAFRDDALAQQFRRLVESRMGTIKPLPAGSFKESGTMVDTVVVTMHF